MVTWRSTLPLVALLPWLTYAVTQNNSSMAVQDDQSVFAEVTDGLGKLTIAMVCLGLIVLAVGVLLCVVWCRRQQSEGDIGPLTFRTIR